VSVSSDPQFSIRRATPDDAPTLAALGAATFSETFGHLYPAEDLRSFLAGSHSVEAWARMLADSERAVWAAWPATIPAATPIGFIAVGPCKLPVDQREAAAGEIQQLYVLAQYQSRRLGSRLMDAALEWLEARGRMPLYIGVWSQNHGAQRFYRRFGFDKVGEYGFAVGKTVDREFILKRK